MHTINYHLIGSVPQVEHYRDRLDALIARYEDGSRCAAIFRDQVLAAFLEGGPAGASRVVDEQLKSPIVLERLATGVTIELCAQHFYGIDLQDSIAETIAAIRAADSELEHGK